MEPFAGGSHHVFFASSGLGRVAVKRESNVALRLSGISSFAKPDEEQMSYLTASVQ